MRWLGALSLSLWNPKVVCYKHGIDNTVIDEGTSPHYVQYQFVALLQLVLHLRYQLLLDRDP